MCTPSEAESSATPQDKDDLPPVTTTEVTSGNEELNNKQEEVKDENDVTPLRRFCRRAIDFYWANDFLILIVLAILLARAYPPLGAIYLAPQITADWIAVVFIFLLSGLDLKTEEFKNAFKQVYFNLFVQVFNFLIVSAVAFGVSRGLAKAGLLSQDLADGMVICSCLPMAISMGTVLTRSSNGDEAAAIFNSAFANLAGVFISPALILGYLGTEGDMDLVNVFYKLALKVLLPILVGQIVQKTSKAAVAYVKKYKKYFGLAQKYCLVFIVYTVFCKTFSKGGQRDIGSVFFMVLFQLLLLATAMIGAWYSMKLFFRDMPKQRVCGLFSCTQKTVAVGVPLIGAIYGDNPSVGLYTLPLIIWHPLQLLIGSSLVPRLSAFVESETERLAALEGNGNDDDNSGDLERAQKEVGGGLADDERS